MRVVQDPYVSLWNLVRSLEHKLTWPLPDELDACVHELEMCMDACINPGPIIGDSSDSECTICAPPRRVRSRSRTPRPNACD